MLCTPTLSISYANCLANSSERFFHSSGLREYRLGGGSSSVRSSVWDLSEQTMIETEGNKSLHTLMSLVSGWPFHDRMSGRSVRRNSVRRGEYSPVAWWSCSKGKAASLEHSTILYDVRSRSVHAQREDKKRGVLNIPILLPFLPSILPQVQHNPLSDPPQPGFHQFMMQLGDGSQKGDGAVRLLGLADVHDGMEDILMTDWPVGVVLVLGDGCWRRL